GTAIEQRSGDIEVAVDRRNQQRTRFVAGCQLIDVGAGVQERLDGGDETLTRRQMDRREPALCVHELVQLVLAIDSCFALRARIEPILLDGWHGGNLRAGSSRGLRASGP